jgi:hypothetical protein
MDYNTPFIECPNLIKDNSGVFGIKELNLLHKCMKIYDNLFNNNNNNNSEHNNKGHNNILWFNENFNNICPLSEKIKHIEKDRQTIFIKFLIQDLIKQLSYLESESKTLVSININDIIVIENNYFLFINEFKVCKLCSEPNFALNYMPIPVSDYISPEILSTKLVLPLKFHKKSCYWSLGALALDILFEYKIDGEYDENKFNQLLNPLRYNPLYNFFKRSLQKDVENRNLIMI